MKGIMFNEHFGLESAVLSLRKIQTRRIVKFNKDIIVDKIGWSALVKEGFYEVRGIHADGTYGSSVFRMPYQVGEVVAIKQSYETIGNAFPHGMIYTRLYEELKLDKSNGVAPLNLAGWNNKMFVKNDLMPHRIKITNIRVERLQDISEADCLREGVEAEYISNPQVYGYEGSYYYYKDSKNKYPHRGGFDTPKQAFASLIDKVSGKGTWASNPYVWVIDFELTDKTE